MNFLNLMIVILVHSCVTVCEHSEKRVQVELKQGVLLGIVNETFFKKLSYNAFLGIPYAEPPVGELRFQPPKAHQGWDDKYEAYDNKPTCLQFSSRMRNGEPFGISGSEDCLYISVFAPSLANSAPVVVFDYNDSFRTAFNGTKTYSPEFFIEEDVIVVTISHRLGLIGYLTTEDEVIPGNNGIRDFILGLQWVKDNIKHFGGDPERVTLMGNSGGAALIEILLYSEKAKGLFSAAIMHSGTAMESSNFFNNPKVKAFELGEQLEIKTDDSKVLLEELQKIDFEALLMKEMHILDNEEVGNHQKSTLPFAPTLEHESTDAVLTLLPENGKVVNDVPVLIGFNSREGLDLISHFIFRPEILPTNIEENLLHFPIRSRFRFDKESLVFKEATKEILDFYFGDKVIHYANILEYAVYAGDTLNAYAINYATKKLAADLESPIFYYMFDFRGQLNENTSYLTRYARFNIEHRGATISDELCYLHLCSRIRKEYEILGKLVSEQAEFKVLKNMVRMWTNFAKTRNPTPSKNKDNILKGFIWEPLTKTGEELNYLHITKKLVMKKDPLGERGKFWDQFLDKYSKMVVDGVVMKDYRDEL